MQNLLPNLPQKYFSLEHLISITRKHTTLTQLPDGGNALSNYWNFFFVESGTALITVGEKNYTVESGHIIFVFPNQYHYVRCADDSTVSYIHCSFITDSTMMHYLKNAPIRCSENDYAYLIAALNSATEAVSIYKESSNYNYKDVNQPIFLQKLQIANNSIELFILSVATNKPAEAPKESHKQTRHANITAGVEEYLSERVRETISLQDTAQHFGYSVSNIQKIFKAVTGQSIIVYFNKLKLEEAKKLIAENTMTFSQIASYLGYSNPNYFSRIFKTTVGMTPTEYANLHQKKPVNALNDSGKPRVKPPVRVPKKISKKSK